jgi:hypothetical protein
MFGSDFYYSSIRRYVTVFGSMFADLQISRLNSAGQQIQAIPVPIAYGPKEKWLMRISQNPNLNAQVQVQLPRMSFEIVGFTYAGERKLPTTVRTVHESASDKNKFKYQYTPVPWDIDINLYSYVRNADDGMQIVEQIVPYFGPEWNVSVNLVPSMDIAMDIPVTLKGMSIDDDYQGDYDTRRALIQTFNFTLKAWMYGPVKRTGIIKRADVNTFIPNGEITEESMAAANTIEKYFVQPGLYANGVGTTNPDASINYRSISANTDWKYAANTVFYG